MLHDFLEIPMKQLVSSERRERAHWHGGKGRAEVASPDVFYVIFWPFPSKRLPGVQR